ncbi:MAG: L-seryl-tRNA(Sec) selenium transferase [Planctomycetaceae bacterium]
MKHGLSLLPSVTELLQACDQCPQLSRVPNLLLKRWIRTTLHERRSELAEGRALDHEDRHSEKNLLTGRLRLLATRSENQQIRKVINATGIVIHTGLGRSPLSQWALSAIADCSGCANVELNLETGQRTHRGFQTEEKLQALTGCEDSIIVNNNAAATLLTLHAVQEGVRNEVLISRGQLVEIGGSFRLPEIFSLSGAMMREIGTTNRTRLSDYEINIRATTAAILRVHPSNYRVVGFTESPSISALCQLGQRNGLPVIDDIGSGSLIDPAQSNGVTQTLSAPVQAADEPTFSASLAAGADLVLGSGDKLLGGPQCGIIVGSRHWIRRLRQHPLARAVRVDKLTLAALSATLDHYLNHQIDQIPVWRMLRETVPDLRCRAEWLASQLPISDRATIDIEADESETGGGSLPTMLLPTIVLRLRVQGISTNILAQRLRTGRPGVVPRISDDAVVIDLRSVLPEDVGVLAECLTKVMLP